MIKRKTFYSALLLMALPVSGTVAIQPERKLAKMQ